MRFIPFIYKYKYYVSLLVFLITCIIVGLLWENYSGSILVNLLVPVASLLLTVFITMIIEKQNGNFSFIHNRFRICNQLTYHGNRGTNKRKQKDISNLYRIINDYFLEHLAEIEKNTKGQEKWRKKLFGNIPKKIEKYNSLILLQIKQYMPEKIKDEFLGRCSKDYRNVWMTSVLLNEKSVEEAICNRLRDTGCQIGPNEFHNNYFTDYLFEPTSFEDNDEDYNKLLKENKEKLSEIESFVLNSKVNYLLSKYKSALWRYYKITKRNVVWYHKLYSQQFYSLIRAGEDFDDMKKNLDNVIYQIQESITDQTSDLDDIITNTSKELEEMTADIVNRAAEEIIDEIKSN